MGRTPSRTNKKTSESRGENGKKPQSLTEGINEKVNAAEEKVQEIEERGKPKRRTVAEVTKLLEEAEKRAKQAEEQVQQQQVRIKNLEEYSAQRNKDLAEAEELNKILQGEGNQKAEAIRILNDNLKASSDKNEKLSKVNQDVRQQNSYLTEAIRQGALKSDKEVTDAVNAIEPKAEKVKTDNSGTTEETVAPETGEAKVKGEPEVKTEQAQATQEPKSEANARPGTGEATKDNVMSPEDAFKFFNDKKNYERASTVFKTPSFDRYIDSATGKWIPRSYFDAFNARDGINPKKFTFEHFKAKIPEDPGKPLTAEQETADLYNKTKAAEDYDKEYENYNTGFKAYLRKHPKLNKLIKGGGTLGILYSLGQMFNDAYTAGQNDKDELQNIVDKLNDDDDPEYPGLGNGNNSPENIAAQLKGADESTETPEDNSGTIEQAIAEQAPMSNAEPENTQVAANAATSTNTKANNAPASTAESAPTQGLPPVVTRNTPSTNPDSSGMTYSQRVEAGQAPQAGSMTYNANNPDLVTANLINAMNQAPQAGSDAIGYGDLYDQNFIDFWAKRNPNLAFGVSQGRKS